MASPTTRYHHKRFSELKKSQKAVILQEFYLMLNNLSNSDPIPLLLSFLESQRGRKYFPDLLKERDNSKKLKKIVQNIKNLHNMVDKEQKKQKLEILATVSTEFSERELKEEHGFDITKDIFVKSRRPFKQKKKQGRKPLSEQIRERVLEFIERNTCESSNRTIEIKGLDGMKRDIAVRYPSCCIHCLFCDFRRTNSDIKISESLFRKITPKNIKSSGRKRTDLCQICEPESKKVKKLRSLETIENPSPDIKDKIKTLKETLKKISEHKERAKYQRGKFKEQLSQVQSSINKAVILLDFKENLIIGGSPNETNQDYYNKKQITCLGIIVFFQKQVYVFDILSEDLKHDAFFVIQALKLVTTHEEFKKLKIEEVSIWFDGGPHFKNYEIAGFFSSDFCNQFKKFEWNHFIQYHGKSYCDSHFSVLGRIYKRYEHNKGKIKSIDDLISIGQEQLDKMKENHEFNSRKNRKFEQIYYILTKISIPLRTDKIQNPIVGIKQKFFSFKVTEDHVEASSLTDESRVTKFPRKKTRIQKRKPESNEESSKRRKTTTITSPPITITPFSFPPTMIPFFSSIQPTVASTSLPPTFFSPITVPTQRPLQQISLQRSPQQAPSIQVPSIQVPSTRVPSTQIPSTQVPSIQVPSTRVPSTRVPSTRVPSTRVPSTRVPSTRIPSTRVPSTQVPSTQTSSIQVPSIQVPSQRISLQRSSQQIPLTRIPSTRVPSTRVPSTRVPSTRVPSTQVPTQIPMEQTPMDIDYMMVV
jgi:hypothetical protein